MTDTSILGLRVLLDRTDLCHANVAIVRAGADGSYELQCEECGSCRGALAGSGGGIPTEYGACVRHAIRTGLSNTCHRAKERN
jgi:hypothetical protein